MPKGVYPRKTKSLAERFWVKVKRGTPSECWPWQGACTPEGYGKIGKGKRGEGWELTHRVAYALDKGEILEGVNILHSCDNPPCCNPSHLRPGTHTENLIDRLIRGKRGSRMRLTVEQVLEIRTDVRKYQEIAREYGIGIEAVGRIKRNKSWEWVKNG